MNINRVEGVPFTQIANTALRDTRLSFRARGILAMVLSHSGEWTAPARWIVQQGTEGRDAIQKALNELTEFGYRTVEHHATITGIRTVTVWRHTPEVSDSPFTGILYHEDPVSLETRAASEDYLSEEHSQKTIEEHKPVADAPGFDEFWDAFGYKRGKTDAQKAWVKAVRVASPDVIIAAAARYRAWLDGHPNPPHQKWAQGWLTGQRWEDELPPYPKGKQSRTQKLEALSAKYAAMDDRKEIGS